MGDRLPVSVLLLARDEAASLEALLPTLAFAAEVVVVIDAATRDDSAGVATRAGARVLTRALDGFGPQRQFALEHLEQPWVLWIDADERLDAGAPAVFARAIASGDANGFRLRRRTWFLGRPIRFCGWGRERVLRLFRREQARFDAAPVHERVHVDGRVADLDATLEHLSYPTWDEARRKLLQYSSANAERLARDGRGASLLDVALRPPLRFLRMYVLQLGVLDGGRGLLLCALASTQVFLKYAGRWAAGRARRSVSIAFFGAWDAGYPRNRILRDGLVQAGARVVGVRVAERRAVFRYPALAWRFARTPEIDAVFVPSFRHKDVPLARWLAGSRPVVFDPLVSRWDTLVEDWGLHAADSAQAGWNRGIDRLALTLPDAIVCDTWAHARLFETLGADPAKLRRVAVGAEQVFFDLPPPAEADAVELLYVGGFLPLHGVPTLIEALALLERDASLPPFRVRLVGRGIEVGEAKALAEQRALRHARFEGWRPYEELPDTLATVHVVLGAFGSSDKAGRVVPHKVWQGLASGRAVVTGAGEGIAEWFEHDVHLWAVPREDPAALAAGLARVVRDGALRRRLGEAGRRRALEVGTPARLGRELLDVFEQVGRRR